MNFLDDASKLTQFDISFLHLSVPATLYDKLAKCLHLRILSLGNIGITFETFPSFSHMIQLLVNLEILYLKQSKCEDKILERMCMLLGEHKMISVVGFEHAALTNKKDWVLHRYNLFNRDFTQYPDYAIIRNPEKIPGSCLIKKCDLCKANCGFLDLCEWARRRPVVVLRKHASSYKYV